MLDQLLIGNNFVSDSVQETCLRVLILLNVSKIRQDCHCYELILVSHISGVT